MKQLFISLCALVAVACSTEERTPVLLFDKSHGQCLGSSYTADVVPDYEKMAADNGAEFVVNEDQPLHKLQKQFANSQPKNNYLRSSSKKAGNFQ